MGYYFYFWTAPPSGMAEQVSEHAVREWLDFAQKASIEFPDDFSPRLLHLAETLLRGWPATDLNPQDHATFDALLHDIYLSAVNGFISDAWLPPTATTGTLASRWYREDFERVEPSLSPSLRQSLRWPLIGRPIGRDAERFSYCPQNDSYRMAYWTATEVKQIGQAWPFGEGVALQALREALTTAQTQDAGLTMLCT